MATEGSPPPHGAPASPAAGVPAAPGPALAGAGPLVARPGSADDNVTDRVLTVPNALSLLRLLGVPLFLWLVLGPEADGWAIVVLAVSGWTDYFDGLIARKYGLISRVGQLLDPLADRLYILTTVLAFTARGILPLYLTLILLSRDVFLAALLPPLKRAGYGPLPVHFMGKAATYNLLFSFPLLLLGAGEGTPAAVGDALGWAFGIWGVTLYWWAGVLYARQVVQLVRPGRAGGTPPASPAGAT